MRGVLKHRLLVLLVLTAVTETLLSFRAIAAELKPASVTEVLEKASINQLKMNEALQQYTFREHYEISDASKDGKPGKTRKNEDYEILFFEGGHYRKLVLRNGKPLASWEARRIEADLRKAAKARHRGGSLQIQAHTSHSPNGAACQTCCG